jgi:molybdopterin-dependent oxidoreductase alpha subunit
MTTKAKNSKAKYRNYTAPTGGWGSVKSLGVHSISQRALHTLQGLMKDHNKPGGYMCTSCAWARPGKPHLGEFCENGAKATFWDLTAKRAAPEFFQKHSVSELLTWTDYDLEDTGRLTHPLRYDPASDRLVEVTWEEAFAAIGSKLKTYEPKKVVFYASGRASLETSYMYQLLARAYGNNNLPDSSNMCHETTSVALPQSIGTPVGTILLEDYKHTDCILSFGQNVGTNAPRLLHTLQEVRERDVPIIVFNPLRERGWEEFVSPQNPVQMVTGKATQIATQYYQLSAAGDIAAIAGMAKFLLEWDDQAKINGTAGVLDQAFIDEHTHGFDEFEAHLRSLDWDELTEISGLPKSAMEAAARTYANAKNVIAIYGMGLTQHRYGVSSIQMLVNLMLMRGNIGRPGAGMCPVRGHSNVQGQRTVGIAEKVELVPLDKLKELYHFEPPREDGLNTVDACEEIVAGRISAFISLGGNFIRAIPDSKLMEEKWRTMDLSVQIATKLNKSHLVMAKNTYILPTIVRSEIDEQQTGPQVVTMEDSTTCIMSSRGKYKPAHEGLLSEPKIVAEMAKACLSGEAKIPWDEWVGNYALIRDAIEATYPEQFKDFNARMDIPGGFARPVAARHRKWETDTGKANFKLPKGLYAGFDLGQGKDKDVLRLVTLRSNDQFNTTVYGYSDRLRGIEKSRMIVMINSDDRIRLGFKKDQFVRLEAVSDDGVDRHLSGLQLIDYNIPAGTCAGYFPELNCLVPLWQYAEESMTPASKSVPVRVVAQ